LAEGQWRITDSNLQQIPLETLHYEADAALNAALFDNLTEVEADFLSRLASLDSDQQLQVIDLVQRLSSTAKQPT